MNHQGRGCWLGFVLLLVGGVGAAGGAEPPIPAKIDFNRDVRPILSDNCYACHGPDKNKRKAQLRLDLKEGLFKGKKLAPVVPGKLEESELYQRITAADKDERMPDPKSGKSLTARQIAVIKKWIEQGAEWKGHWAYLPPVRPELPVMDEPGFVKNPIDRFILAKIKDAGLHHSPEADRITLIRRLSFDLLGLPPSKAEVDAFVNDQRPDAYEILVERLLASPHFGERLAIYWLDLVRYADSIGYHSDNTMNVSSYRDYVIQAFNSNRRFDQFTIEQLAGDLLPNATTEQKVASAYNRLLQTTEEGGAQAKEYEAKYAADRVRSVSSVWLGSTMGCCQCHDHKFDPFATKDFYRMAAFFADVQEAAVGRREPGMPVPDKQQAAQLKKLDEQIAAIKKKLETPRPELAATQTEWEKSLGKPVDWKVVEPETLQTVGGTTLTKHKDGIVKTGGTIATKETYTFTAKTDLKGITAFRLEVFPEQGFAFSGPGTSDNGNFVLTEFKVTLAAPGKPVQRVALRKASADFSQEGFNVSAAIDGKKSTGWAIFPEVGKAHTAIFESGQPTGADGSTTLIFTLEQQSIYPKHNIAKFRLSVTTAPNPSNGQTLPASLKTALAVQPDKRSEQQKKELAAYYRSIAPLLNPIRQELAGVENQKTALVNAIPKCLISIAGTPRLVRVLPRGNWMDDSGEVVEPGVPQFMKQLPVQGRRGTRLDLAQWIVARDNPLTARTFSNRLWKLFFGQGLSKILDDVGAQGDWPSHPELLDWLAVEFMDSGWDIKHMVRLLVTSGAYRQSSRVAQQLKEKDPYNRLIARQGRFRLDAEMVRDNALAISGLLVQQIGGSSVKPYQPAGYWSALNFPPREWVNDKGDGLYRRGLYTHWQRTFLHPSMLAFDAPSREECTCDRARSNIPQQALVLLDDPTYVEAARVFAEHIIKQGGGNTDERLAWAYGRALSRNPKAEEVQLLKDVLQKHSGEYQRDKEAAKKLVSTGAWPMSKDVDISELAAWTSVARVILNLHETITRN